MTLSAASFITSQQRHSNFTEDFGTTLLQRIYSYWVDATME